ncbi:vacuolar protein sorting-associated protein 26C isoform X2 [Coccinella septempunctata]|uniref:vacuolar protein sorting-associated protein 26C isoform X2 n=1 Tax=Coccinella septempunctata TaxID=41139 RepID=UPI001D092735|nr:vacuolar protein sorting-associated protein 26C isoform X2 [Coccinella septempunctata]
MSISVDVIVKRADKIYYEGELVSGIIQISASTDVKHEGIILTMEGAVNLQISSRNAGIIDAFYNSVKPIILVNSTCEISSGSRIPAGITQIPFQIPLKAKTNRTLYETYHGVYVNICYTLRCDMKRSFLSKDIQKTQEFLVQCKHSILPSVRETRGVEINLTPQSILGNTLGAPDFHLAGKLDSTYCNISRPFKGHLELKKCSVPLRSLEIQLVRVETCGCAEGFAKESTEIQNIQIGDGDLPLNTKIPIYMIFPRLFTCPTLVEHNFKIEFEINIVIIFENDHHITNNFPIILYRD